MSKFKKIKKWANSHGYSVRFSRKDEVNFTDKEITLFNSKNKNRLVYSFLHECGHIIVSNKKSYNKKYKILNKGYLDGRHTRGLLYKYKQLREEIQAWEMGFKLSKKIGIKINKDDYDNYASKCFNTYTK